MILLGDCRAHKCQNRPLMSKYPCPLDQSPLLQSLANPVRVGYNMARVALLGKHNTKENAPCCNPTVTELAKLCNKGLCSLQCCHPIYGNHVCSV